MFSLLEQLKDCKAFLPKNVSPKRLAEGKGGQDLEWVRWEWQSVLVDFVQVTTVGR